MRKALTVLVLVPCLLLSVAGKKDKKKKGNEEPKVGWVKPSEDAAGACLYPPKWDDLTTNPRQLARAQAIADVLAQWKGERGDGVEIPTKFAYELETILLGDPKDIEAIAAENAQWCEKRMAGTVTNEQWGDWVAALAPRLTAGECRGSLLPQEMHDYLNIDGDWHMKMPFCKDDIVIVTASTQDKYQIEAKGPWIDVAGDKDKPAKGEGFPCTVENCYEGTMLVRFRNYDGSIEKIYPMGGSGALEIRIPDHGHLSVQINDDDWHDNHWKVDGGMQHHTGVSYLPK